MCREQLAQQLVNDDWCHCPEARWRPGTRGAKPKPRIVPLCRRSLQADPRPGVLTSPSRSKVRNTKNLNGSTRCQPGQGRIDSEPPGNFKAMTEKGELGGWIPLTCVFLPVGVWMDTKCFLAVGGQPDGIGDKRTRKTARIAICLQPKQDADGDCDRQDQEAEADEGSDAHGSSLPSQLRAGGLTDRGKEVGRRERKMRATARSF